MKVTPEHYKIMKNLSRNQLIWENFPMLLWEMGHDFTKAVKWTYFRVVISPWLQYCWDNNIKSEYEDSHLLTAAKKIYREILEEKGINF